MLLEGSALQLQVWDRNVPIWGHRGALVLAQLCHLPLSRQGFLGTAEPLLWAVWTGQSSPGTGWQLGRVPGWFLGTGALEWLLSALGGSAGSGQLCSAGAALMDEPFRLPEHSRALGKPWL